MSVSNGQIANASTFNTAFMSRTADTDTLGKVDLINVAAASGSTVTNVQRELNAIASWLGKALNVAYNSTPTYSSVTVVANADSLKAAIGKLDADAAVNATSILRGKVSTAAQSFGGHKTFASNVTVQGYLATEYTSVATDANIPALATTTSIVRLTGASTAREIQGMTGAVAGKVVTLHNAAAAVYTVKHASASASAAERFSLPSSTDITLGIGQSLAFFYDAVDSRWKQLSGAGSSGGSSRAVSTFSGTSITPGSESDQTWVYNGGSAQTFSTTGFGTISSLTNGTRFTIMGSSDTNTITIAASDISDGRLINGDAILGKGMVLVLEYNSTLARLVEIGRNF
jgi:hypothetical protein